jgi:hypothetical protein
LGLFKNIDTSGIYGHTIKYTLASDKERGLDMLASGMARKIERSLLPGRLKDIGGLGTERLWALKL